VGEFAWAALPVWYKELEAPMVDMTVNLLLSIPSDRDLRVAYYWPNRRFLEQEQDSSAYRGSERRRACARLQASWCAEVQVPLGTLEAGSSVNGAASMGKSGGSSGGQHGGGVTRWEVAFAAVRCRKLLFWPERDYALSGLPAETAIALEGHAGVSPRPSPMLARELGPELAEMVVVVFGQNATARGSFSGADEHGGAGAGMLMPEQIPIMFHSHADREGLTEAVLMAQQKSD
jgi:hypothetical protein